MRAAPLLTPAQRTQLLENGIFTLTGGEHDPQPVVRLFTPDAAATWLLTELDPDDEDTLFGLCDLGLGCPELGYVSLAELLALRGPLGLPVERDLHFHPDQPLSAYAAAARDTGRVLATVPQSKRSTPRVSSCCEELLERAL